MKFFSKASLCITIAFFALTACGSRFAGSWSAVAVIENGQRITDDSVNGYIVLELDSNGKGRILSMGEEEAFEWKSNGDVISLVIDGEMTEAVLDGEELVLKLGDVKVCLEKTDRR